MINEDFKSKYEFLEEEYEFLERQYLDLKDENDNLKHVLSMFISYTNSIILNLASDISELETPDSTYFNLSDEGNARKEMIRVLHNVKEDLEVYSGDLNFEEID